MSKETVTTAFESLVNSSSGKTKIPIVTFFDMFESLVNSSSGKTVYRSQVMHRRLRALLIQVVVKQKEEGVFVPTV